MLSKVKTNVYSSKTPCLEGSPLKSKSKMLNDQNINETSSKTPMSYDTKEHEEFLNLTMYLNKYQQKMKIGNNDEFRTLKTRSESHLDFKTFIQVKSLNKGNPYNSLLLKQLKHSIRGRISNSKSKSRRPATSNPNTSSTFVSHMEAKNEKKEMEDMKREIRKIQNCTYTMSNKSRQIIKERMREDPLFAKTHSLMNSHLHTSIKKKRPNTSFGYVHKAKRRLRESRSEKGKRKEGAYLTQSMSRNGQSITNEELSRTGENINILREKSFLASNYETVKERRPMNIKECQNELDNNKTLKKELQNVEKAEKKIFKKLKLNALQVEADIKFQQFIYNRMMS